MSQRSLWNTIHSKDTHEPYAQRENAFARKLLEYVKQGALLEIGCGSGVDSAFFAYKGFAVTAIDFSSEAIARCKRKYPSREIVFKEVDISEGLPFENGVFDAVYARLSLHYFKNRKTKEVFNQIRRVLKKGGVLAVMCKSTKDPLFGKGKRVEEHMFIENGHIRHFFDSIYTRECLGNHFTLLSLEEKEGDLYGKPSAWIEAVAQAVHQPSS